MFKMKIDAAELKKILEKGLAAVPKKSSFQILECVKLNMAHGVLDVAATDTDIYVSAQTSNCWDTSDGTILIDGDDLKLLLKMKGEISIEEKEDKVEIKNGKKALRMNLKALDAFPEWPVITSDVKSGKIQEKDLLESMVNLAPFLRKDGNNEVLTAYNVNWNTSRIYACDGYRLGYKKLNTSGGRTGKTYLILGSSLPVFKKLLDKKSEKGLICGESGSFIYILGEDFQYIQRKISQEYLDVEVLLNGNFSQEFDVDKEELKAVVKYDVDLGIAKERKPIVMIFKNGEMQVFGQTTRFESVDHVEISNSNMEEHFAIGFNPQYWLDALNVVDAETVHVQMAGNKNPALLTAGEYGFLILAVAIKEEMLKKKIAELAA